MKNKKLSEQGKPKLYKFPELHKEIQEKVISSMRTVNVDYFWFNVILQDAENIGMILVPFDVDKAMPTCTGRFTKPSAKVADKILKEHAHSETYEIARQYKRGSLSDENFLKRLLEEYANIIKREYATRITDEAVKRTLMENEDDFTEEGTLVLPKRSPFRK